MDPNASLSSTAGLTPLRSPLFDRDARVRAVLLGGTQRDVPAEAAPSRQSGFNDALDPFSCDAAQSFFLPPDAFEGTVASFAAERNVSGDRVSADFVLQLARSGRNHRSRADLLGPSRPMSAQVAVHHATAAIPLPRVRHAMFSAAARRSVKRATSSLKVPRPPSLNSTATGGFGSARFGAARVGSPVKKRRAATVHASCSMNELSLLLGNVDGVAFLRAVFELFTLSTPWLVIRAELLELGDRMQSPSSRQLEFVAHLFAEAAVCALTFEKFCLTALSRQHALFDLFVTQAFVALELTLPPPPPAGGKGGRHGTTFLGATTPSLGATVRSLHSQR
jgi:hypothetical protein